MRRRDSSSLRWVAREIFSERAAWRGSREAAMEGCVVEEELARVNRISGFESMSARSCLLV